MVLIKNLGLIAASLVGAANAADLPAIEIVGNKFFYSNNGSQFFMKGIAYQQDTTNITAGETFVDPLADGDACARDIPYLTAVATNTIRVYALNETLDHSSCLQQLQNAGIYVIADLSEPGLSIDRSNPTWNVELYNRYTSIVDEFANYTNILGFFAGNEVTNDDTNTDASAFVKAAVRDTKAYIKSKSYRNIPVGYSANDDSSIRVAMANYFACGDPSQRVDFYGMNMYSWCGDSNFQLSGYADRTKEFSNLTIPLFFSEYGCNEVTPRQFTEVQAIYGPNMTGVWSGGIVYMYFEEANNYGLVTVDGNTVSTLADYSYYSSEINHITPSSAKSSTISASSATLSCPTGFSNWNAATSLPPTPNDELCSCMQQSLSCVVADSVDPENYSDLFSYVCGAIDCSGIEGNGTTGKYGAYSFCSSKQQLSFVLNLYYQSQGKSSNACAFSGSASVVSASTQSVCSAALSAIGSAGTGSYSGTLSGVTSGSAASASATASGKSTAKTTASASPTKSSSASNSNSSASSTSTKSSKSSGTVVKVNGEYVMISMFVVLVGGVSLLLI